VEAPCNRLLPGLAIFFWAAIGHAEAPPKADDPGAILLRIAYKVAERLSLLPNYTCHEVIDRFVQPSNTGHLRRYDTVELEVAFDGQNELFARPGDTHFQEQPITEMVRTGTISNGAFGSLVGSIFLGGVASFEYSGASEQDGHKTYRYDFQVPQEKSYFSVNHNFTKAIVAYRGSFWADIETYDLVRVEITADQIPSDLGIAFVREREQYAALRIRDSEFLLPLHAETESLDDSGNLSRNDLTLEQCREFTGQSTVTFGVPVDGATTDRAAPK
jgi:hypothetical protein